MQFKTIFKRSISKIVILSFLLTSFYFIQGFQLNDGLLKKRPPTCCSSKYSNDTFEKIDSKLLGKEFKRLKKSDCEDCNRFGSDFAEIMRALETRLTGKSKKYIRRIMGKPDEKYPDELIYYWRGKHDYLIFNFSEGKDATAIWHYDYE